MMGALRNLVDDLSVSMDLTKFDITPLRRRLAFMSGQRAAFYRHLASQQANGITVEKALDKFRVRLLKRRKKIAASVIDDIARRYSNGRNLAAALTGFIPDSDLVLISSGETSGNLASIVDRMLDANDSTKRIQRILFSAMFPPIVYLFAIYTLLSAIGGQVLPSMMQNGASLSNVEGIGKLVVALGEFAVSPAVIIPPLGTVVLVVTAIWSLPRWTGVSRRRADKVFPFSYYRDIQGYVWLLAFTGLLKAGMDPKKAMQEQLLYASPWLAERLSRIHWLYGSAVRPLGDALMESGFDFPNPILIDDISSYAEFGDFAEKINTRALQWSKELEYGASQRVIWGALIFELLIFGIIALLQQGITDIANAMAS